MERDRVLPTSRALECIVLALLIACTTGFFGCGSSSDAQPLPQSLDAASEPEAAAEAEAGTMIAPPVEPDLPACLQGSSPTGCAAEPKFEDWTCPQGWTAQSVAESDPWKHSICVPPTPATCPTGEIQYLSETSCHPLGTACPTGSFLESAEILKLAPTFSGQLWYVTLGGSGDGTLGSPLGSVADAVSKASNGDLLVLSLGSFNEALKIDKSVALVGACVSGTEIVAPSLDEADALLDIASNNVLVANLRLGGQRVGIRVNKQVAGTVVDRVEVEGAIGHGIEVLSGEATTLRSTVIKATATWNTSKQEGQGLLIRAGAVTLERLWLEGNHTWALQIDGAATVTATDLVVRKTQPRTADQWLGVGIDVRGGGALTVQRALLEDNFSQGVSARAGSTLALTDAAILGTKPDQSDLTYGRAAQAFGGAKLSLVRTLIDGAYEIGVGFSDAQTQATLDQTIIRNVESSSADGTTGYGVFSQGQTTLALTRTLVERASAVGIVLIDQGKLEAADLVVTDTRSEKKTGEMGIGLLVQDQSTAELQRGTVARNRYAGIVVIDGAEAKLADVRATGTIAQEAGGGGRGVVVGAASATLERCVLNNNEEAELSVDVSSKDPTTPGTAELKQSLLQGKQRASASQFGSYGLSVQGGSQATVRQVVVVGTAGVGIRGDGEGTIVDLQDVRLADIGAGPYPWPSGPGTYARSVEASHGAQISLARGRIERTRGFGVTAFHAGTKLTTNELLVTDTLPTYEPGKEGSGERYGGIASASLRGASLVLKSFELSANAGCGLQIALEGKATATSGFIHDNAIGFNVQVPNYDTSSVLGPTVRFRDNGNNVDSQELYVPEPSEALGQ